MRRGTERIFDEYLVTASRAGDRAALERLAARWAPRLYRHACRVVGDRERARDAVQSGWADIIRGLPRLADAALFPAWAFRIVTRRCVDEIRAGQSRRRLEADYAAGGERPLDHGAADMEAHAEAPALLRALASLPAEQRAAIALFHLEDMSVGEIAAALEIPAGTVKTRLMHARRKMRAALNIADKGGPSND